MNNFSEYQLEVLEKSEVDCIDIMRLMGDYYDSDLPKTLHGRIHAHIKNCPICSEMYSGYSLVVKLAAEFKQEVKMTDDAKQRLRSKLSQRLGINL